ncbi:MAG: ankyrin repeat domain-containing protein [Dechloromonas sp.]|nr:MAG: ankyrin repeat domain-containing protein [Dechloromonas sp.]
MFCFLPCLFFCLAGSAFAESIAGAGELPVHVVARQGTGPALATLLRDDARLRDARTLLGSTPLHLAAMNPDLSAMNVLLAAGADPNARDGDGSTPIHMAAYASRASHVQRLLEAGADPLIKNNAGRDAAAMARKVKADEAAGVISLWLLKGCKAGRPC